MKRALRLLAGAACVSVLAGCVLLGDKLDEARWRFTTIPYFVFDNAPEYKNPEQPPVMEHDTNVALAISGGGLRSAVFAAGVMEQLAYVNGPRGKSALESVDMMSGVSGGSLAAAYYSLYKPARFESPEQKTEFFQHFKSQMTVDFFHRGFVHYLSHPWEAGMKYYTRYRFTQTLANTFDQYLFYGATFDDIHKRELCGEAPVTLLQATSLDNGKKFLFTNLNVCNSVNVDGEALMERLPGITSKRDLPSMQALAQLASLPISQSFGFDSINSDIGAFRIASAVAASSAYPILPGPAALIDYAHDGYVHLGDGGVNDNSGVDALVEAYLSKLSKGSSGKRLVVLSINSAAPVTPRHEGNPNGFVSSITYGERANTILGTRAQSFATVLYNVPDNIKVITINLADCPSAQKLLNTFSRGSISEDEMYQVLAAASEAIQAQRPAIEAVLAGR